MRKPRTGLPGNPKNDRPVPRSSHRGLPAAPEATENAHAILGALQRTSNRLITVNMIYVRWGSPPGPHGANADHWPVPAGQPISTANCWFDSLFHRAVGADREAAVGCQATRDGQRQQRHAGAGGRPAKSPRSPMIRAVTSMASGVVSPWGSPPPGPVPSPNFCIAGKTPSFLYVSPISSLNACQRSASGSSADTPPPRTPRRAGPGADAGRR